jgi:hypothetical protein
MRGEMVGERPNAAVLVLIGICALIYFLDGLIHSILVLWRRIWRARSI